MQGPSRLAEGALAMKKASPTGSLFSSTYAWPETSCATRGFGWETDEDPCFPGIGRFFHSNASKAAFDRAFDDAVAEYRTTYELPEDQAELMAHCTCHPGSVWRKVVASRCEKLNAVGSWVHLNPETGHKLVCQEGPFEHATRALATMKSSLMLPLHLHDIILPKACKNSGFGKPQSFWSGDRCRSMISTWTRVSPMRGCPPGGLGEENPTCSDPGALEAAAAILSLQNGGFKKFLSTNSLAEEILNHPVACDCHADSADAKAVKLNVSASYCDEPAKRSPIRDFWQG